MPRTGDCAVVLYSDQQHAALVIREGHYLFVHVRAAEWPLIGLELMLECLASSDDSQDVVT